jgi:hypothetical protein
MKKQGKLVINPFGPGDATRNGLTRLIALIPEHPVTTVCGVDYVMDYSSWEKHVLPLIG